MHSNCKAVHTRINTETSTTTGLLFTFLGFITFCGDKVNSIAGFTNAIRHLTQNKPFMTKT